VHAATGWISVEFDPAIYKFEANKILIFKKAKFASGGFFFNGEKACVLFINTAKRKDCLEI
jgi:hypothetical protein